MKKIYACACAMFFLFCSSCSGQDLPQNDEFQTKEYLSEYDMQNQFGMLSAICETDKAYYYSSIFGHYLWYVDKETGEYGKLCGNPQCKHEGGACNAYMYTSPMSGLSLYNGRIYWVSTPNDSSSEYYLYSMNLSGTDRKQEQKLIDFAAGINPMVRLHRGYVYAAVRRSDVQGGIPIETLKITQALLGEESSEKIIFELTYEGGTIGYNYQLFRDKMYLIYIYKGSYYVMEYNIEEDEMSLCYQKEGGNVNTKNIWVDENGLYWVEDGIENADYTIMKYDFISRESYSIKKEENHLKLSPKIGCGYFIQTAAQKNGLQYWIKDYEGKMIREDQIQLLENGESPSVEGGWPSGTCVLLSLMWQENGKTTGALIRIPYDITQKEQVLCQGNIS